jgi:hypothetical protein
MKKLLILHITFFSLLTSLCIPEKKSPKPDNEMAIPPVIIYKTKKNYNKNVAVILSDDKSTIVSYPDPKDVYRNGTYCYPTPLKKGYLLDNRGINKNVAFLSITYEEYAALKNPPSIDEMKKMIIDNNPLKSLFQCEKTISNKNSIEELNLLIRKKCKQCTKIK